MKLNNIYFFISLFLHENFYLRICQQKINAVVIASFLTLLSGRYRENTLNNLSVHADI